jgi:hypothetical protein
MVATGVELRTVLWRALAPPGAEVCRLLRVAGGWQLEGTILTAFDRVPA